MQETLVAGMPVMVLDCFKCRKPFIQPSCLSNMRCPKCRVQEKVDDGDLREAYAIHDGMVDAMEREERAEKRGEEKERERCISIMINTVPTCTKECRALVIKAIRSADK